MASLAATLPTAHPIYAIVVISSSSVLKLRLPQSIVTLLIVLYNLKILVIIIIIIV